MPMPYHIHTFILRTLFMLADQPRLFRSSVKSHYRLITRCDRSDTIITAHQHLHRKPRDRTGTVI